MHNQSKTYTEQELVLGLREGSDDAFAYLYDHYSGALMSVIVPIAGNPELAEDVLQEVFINIYRRISSYDAGKGRLYTWMVNIARNAAIDLLRSKGYRQSKQNRDASDAVYADAGSTTPQMDGIGLEKIVNQLKPDQKEVVHMAYFMGMTQEEISEQLKIPLGTVKTRIRAGLMQLRSWLSHEIKEI